MPSLPNTQNKIARSRGPLALVFVLLIVAIMSYGVWHLGVYTGIITPAAGATVAILLVFLPLAMLFSMSLARKRNNPLVTLLYNISTIWFAAIIYLFIGAVLISLVSVFNYTSLYILSWIWVLAIALAIIGGAINAGCIRIKEYVVNSPELAPHWANKKIVLFSDVHIGIVRGRRFMEKVARMVEDLKADIVFLAGDVIDGPAFDYAKGLSPLKNITAQLIYTPGNHEGYNQEPEKFYPVIKSLTTSLIDAKTIINNTQIIGLDYRHESKEQTREHLHAVGFDPAMPSIVIMHDPTNAGVLEDEGVSLALSGHTHKGQFFPFTLFMRRLYKEFRYGENKKGKTTTITTSGVGTTATPIRIGSNPEIVVIKIK